MTSILLLTTVFNGITNAAELQSWNSNIPQSIATLKAPVTIINLWATWCEPCRKEMPEMSVWYQKQPKENIDMVGIALDSAENIRAFLQHTPVSYPIWRYTGNDSRAFMKNLGNSAGGLPFTMIRVQQCTDKQEILGTITIQKLNEILQTIQIQCNQH